MSYYEQLQPVISYLESQHVCEGLTQHRKLLTDMGLEHLQNRK